jgi:hypothetical protein
MRTERFRFLAVVLPVFTLGAIVACSGPEDPAPHKVTKGDDDDDDDKNTKSSDSDLTTKKQTPPASAPPPPVNAAPPPVLDAGNDATPPAPAPAKPAQPQPPATQFCRTLSRCCSTLDFFESLACTGTAMAGNETACGVELGVCSAGGFGEIGDQFGDFFGGGGDDPSDDGF